MATYKKYVNELTQKYGYHPTWDPNTKLNIGDIGVIENGVFVVRDNIKSLGFDIGTIETNKGGHINYSSDTCKEYNLNTTVDIPPTLNPAVKGNADFLVSFGTEGGVYFKANGVKTHKIKHQFKLMEFILKQFHEGKWEKDWVIINELKEAAAGVILYSNSSDASASIKLDAAVGTEKLKMADINSGLEIRDAKNMSVKITISTPITPLFKLMGIKRNWWKLGKAEVRERGLIRENFGDDVLDVINTDIKPTIVNDNIKESETPKNNKLYALLIGINDYKYIGDLGGCIRDIERVEDYLEIATQNKFDLKVKKLLNSDATKKNIIDTLKSHFAGATKHDVLLVWYAGHGAQEHAPEFLKKFEEDDKLEVFCCHDSRLDNGATFLANKELRYVLHQVTQKEKPHTVVVTDCCHSGNIARGLLRSRNCADAIAARTWEGFEFSKEANLSPQKFEDAKDLSSLLPLAQHVHLAACESHQKAKENKYGGVFTSAILEILENTCGESSYRKLADSAHFKLFSTYKQNPKVNAEPIQDENKAFLGGVSVNEPDRAKLRYDEVKGRWMMDKGALKGVSSNANTPNTIKILDANDKLLVSTKTSKVLLDYTYLDTVNLDKLNKDTKYNVLIEDLYKPNIHVFCDGDEEMVKDAMNYYYLHQKDFEDVNVKFVGKSSAVDYVLLAKDDGFEINQLQAAVVNECNEVIEYAYKPIVKKATGNTDEAMSDILFCFEQISNWAFFKNLSQADSAIRDEDVTITIQQDGSKLPLTPTATNNNIFEIDYTKEGKEHIAKLSFEINNNSNQTFRVSLLYLGADFGILNFLDITDDAAVYRLSRDAKINSKWDGSETIHFYLEEHIKKHHFLAESGYLKLIISTDNAPFKIKKESLQNGLPLPCTEDQIDKSTGTKGLRGTRKRLPTEDWLTKTIQLKFKNPDYKK